MATFIGNLLSVAALTWLLVPWANRAFDWWLRPMPDASPKAEAVGVAPIIGLYVLPVVVFALIN